MAIIKQGILGGFKKKIGSVVGSSWKGIATMRSLPLSVANPKTAAQVENRNSFKACAEFASLILASIIKPLMDRFAGQMSGYNLFVKTNKGVWDNPSAPAWADLEISRGKMLAPKIQGGAYGGNKINLTLSPVVGDRYALPTDKIYMLAYNKTASKIAYAGDTGLVRTATSLAITPTNTPSSGDKLEIYLTYLHADGTEVSNNAYIEQTV